MISTFCLLDTEDFNHSYLLNNSDPNIGFGNFGDKERQHAVIDGAFANFSLAYPYPHVLRRQFFPYPWFDLTPPLFLNPKINVTEVITFSEIHKTITGFRGDFRGFQTYFERMQVCLAAFYFWACQSVVFVYDMERARI